MCRLYSFYVSIRLVNNVFLAIFGTFKKRSYGIGKLIAQILVNFR